MELDVEQSAMISEVASLQTLRNHSSDVNSVDFAANYVLVTGSADKIIRVWEWCCGEGYVQCRFSPLKGHKYGVTCVKVSPQSTMLASSSIDGTTFLWNLRTGARLHRMVQTGGEAVRICRFSGNSLLLATADDSGQVCVWDLIRRMLIRSFQQHEGAIQSLCFTPDSAWLVTACTFGVVKVFSVAEICEVDFDDADNSHYQLSAHDSVDDAHDLGVLSCDIAYNYGIPNERVPLLKCYRMATCGNDHHVKLWQIAVLNCKKDQEVHGAPSIKITLERVLEKHSSALTCVRFNASGLLLASCGLDKTTVLWEARTGRMLTTISGHRRYVSCCAFSKTDDLLVTGSNDKSVIVWDLTGKLNESSELVKPTRFGTVSGATDSDQDIRHEKDLMENVEASCENEVQPLQRLDEHSGPVNSVAFYENHLIASGSGDKQIRIWSNKSELQQEVEEANRLDQTENEDESETKKQEGEPKIVNDKQIPNNEESFFLSEESGAVGYAAPQECSNERLFQEEPYSPLEGHKYSVNHVEFSPCGTMLASCSLDGTTVIWDLTESEVRAKSTFVNSGYGIRVCRWSLDGRRIATAGDDETARLWSISSMEELCVLEGHSDAVNAIAFTYDSRYLVTACAEGSWRLFDIGRFEEKSDQDAVDRIDSERAILICEEAHDLGIQGCDFSRTSDAIINGTTYSTGGQLGSNPNGLQRKYLLVTGGNDSLVKLWQITCALSVATGSTSGDSHGLTDEITVSYAKKKIFAGHGGNVINVRFSPTHGEVFASVATDKTARIWSIFTAASLHVLEHHDSLVTSCAFSKNASLFITGSLDRSIVVWKLPERLVSQTVLIESLVNVRKRVSDWKVKEIVQWLTEIGLANLSEFARKANLSGQQLLVKSPQDLLSKFGLSNADERTQVFQQQLHWLKSGASFATDKLDDAKIPHKFLCPITHEIIKEPVRCSDGFTYERAAITEWFLCGRYTSPMTNECLNDATLKPNISLRNEIYVYLYGSLTDSPIDTSNN